MFRRDLLAGAAAAAALPRFAIAQPAAQRVLKYVPHANIPNIDPFTNTAFIARDHAFLVYAGDKAVVEFLQTLPDHKTVVLDVVPTAENLAAEAFRILDSAYHDVYANQLRLERVRLYETPNCWADATRA